MASLEDMIRSAVPDGNIAKPLMLALVGLLASEVGAPDHPVRAQVRDLHLAKAPAAACSTGWAVYWASCRTADLPT
jgi:hypothetical protein